MLTTRKDSHTVSLFFGYVDEDKHLHEQLYAHFSLLIRQQGRIKSWDPRCIRAGQKREEELEHQLNNADIILLLISSDFMQSDYWSSVVMMRALERHRKREARTIPILLRPLDIINAPFSELEILPKGKKAVTRWDNLDEAYEHITSEVRNVIDDVLEINDNLREISEKHILEQDSQNACPYLGLEPYSEQHSSLFFGRKHYIIDLMYKLFYDQRLLLVLGPIGSGKTSVIQAGVIPLLREHNTIIPRSFTWEILTFTPGENPTSRLLSLLSTHDEQDLIESVKVWKKHHPKNERLVLIMDQFEELFRLTKPEEQKYFIRQLLKLTLYDLATILIIMNDGYYNALAEHTDFMKLAEQQISNVPPLTPDEIMEIIKGPADAAKFYFEKNLAEKIADDTMRSTQEPKEQRMSRHSSMLPHLSVGLEQLYNLQEDHCITLKAYEAIGQISEVLTKMATDSFHVLDEHHQHLARRIFVDLVALGDDSEGRFDCRRQKLITKLCYNNNEMQDVRAVVEKLAKAHLLETHFNEPEKDIEVKIIHESLLREWSLLKDWLRDDHQFLLWYQEIERRMQKWLASHEYFDQRDPSHLLRGNLLIEAQLWIAEQPHRLTGDAHNFIRASVALHEREKAKEQAYQEMHVRQDVLLAKQLATKASLIQEQEPRSLRKSLLLAVEALRHHHCVEADQAIRQGLAMLPRLHSRIGMATGQTILFSGNGQCLATAGTNGVSWLSQMDSLDEQNETLPIGNTRAIALSFSGEYLLAGVSTGVTWLINTVERRKVAMIRQDASICCVALTQRDPSIAAIGYENGTIHLCQFLKSDDPLASIPQNNGMQNAQILHTFHHQQAVSSLAFSRNEHYLVSGGMDHIVRVWSIDDGRAHDEYDCKSPICSTLFSPDDTSLAIVSADGKAFVWQWEQKSHTIWKRKQKRIIRIPQAEKIQAVVFGPGRNCLVTASVDGFARIWNLGDMTEVTPFHHNSPISSIDYHQGVDWLAAASTDGIVKIYNVVESIPKYTIPHDTSVLAIALNPQKPYLATADGRGCVWIWHLRDGNLPICFHIPSKVIQLVFGQGTDEKRVYLTLEEVSTKKRWTLTLNVSQRQTRYQVEHALDGDMINEQRQLAQSPEKNNRSVFSPDGCFLAKVTVERLIQVKKADTDIYENVLKVDEDIEEILFSHKGDYIAFLNKKGHVFIWKWREENTDFIALQGEYARTLVFSQDDDDLIVADGEKSVFIWQWKTQTKEPKYILRHDSTVHMISLCPDKNALLTISSDKSARIWDIATGLPVLSLLHKEDVVSAIFDNEGTYIATMSNDCTVRIWDAHNGEQRACLRHNDSVYAVAFSKDGRYLATACDDFIVRIWQWRREDLEAEVKLRVMGNLTSEEWQEYMGNEPYHETFDDLGWRELPSEEPFGDE